MQVKLISMTQPLIMTENLQNPRYLTPEEYIALVARVSNPDNQWNFETATKLLRYLIRNSHWSPFEMVDMTFEINTTRDIVRQILRHWSFAFQEFSQRYADPTKIGFTIREVRLQDSKNRQNSIEIEDEQLDYWWKNAQWSVISLAKEIYKIAIEKGIAKEVARAVLPEGLTNSRLYMKGSLRDFYHYCNLRTGNGTQKEHKLVAEEIKKQIIPHFSFFEEVQT